MALFVYYLFIMNHLRNGRRPQNRASLVALSSFVPRKELPDFARFWGLAAVGCFSSCVLFAFDAEVTGSSSLVNP